MLCWFQSVEDLEATASIRAVATTTNKPACGASPLDNEPCMTLNNASSSKDTLEMDLHFTDCLISITILSFS